MRKLVVFIAAVFTMMISCAFPLFHSYATYNNFPDSLDDIKSQGYSGLTDNVHYIYCNYDIYYDFAGAMRSGAFCIRYLDSNINNLYVEYSHNTLVLRTINLSNTIDIVSFYDYYGLHDSIYNACAVTFDFNTNTCYFVDNNADYVHAAYYDQTANSFEFYNFETNFTEYSPTSLDLSISFRPSLSGTVSRTETIDGKSYTSDSLDMYVSNNGSDAQFLMCILPTQGTLSFPDNTLQDARGFIGSPTFVYVADEWSNFNTGLGETQIYAGCAWHTVPSGFINQIYHIPWTSMDLKANTSYDVVVYACINNDFDISDYPPNMRNKYPSTSNLVDVEEVYRSTFTISDPAVFNADTIDEAGASHAWNPNIDNTSLFTVGSAYLDDLGNLNIRGSSSGIGAPFGSSANINVDATTDINTIFVNFFKFLSAGLNCFPAIFISIIGVGISALVVVGVIKAAMK